MRRFIVLLCGSCMLMSANCSKENNPPAFFEATVDGTGYIAFPDNIQVKRVNTFAGTELSISAANNKPGFDKIFINIRFPDDDPAKLVGTYTVENQKKLVYIAMSADTSTVAAFSGTNGVIDSTAAVAAGVANYHGFTLQIIGSTSKYISGTFSGDLFWKAEPGVQRKTVTYGSFLAKY